MKTKVLLLIGTVLFGMVSFASDPTMKVKISNDTETRVADVVDLGDGTKALRTSGLVQIEELFGQDPQGTVWAFIGTDVDASGVGDIGDTIRTQIVAAPAPLNASYPAVDVSTAVTATHTLSANPERELALEHCDDLTSNPSFAAAKWKCEVIKDFSGIFISSKLFNEFGTRTASASFDFTSTGTTVVTKPFETIERRGLSTELARSPNDPRKGILAISGSVTTLPGSVNNFFVRSMLNGVSEQMAVDASTTPQTFNFLARTDGFNRNVQRIACGMSDNGIKFGQFLATNNPITNGIEFKFTINGGEFTLPLIKSTDDWKHVFTFGIATNFALDVQAGRDDLLAVATFNPPVVLKNNTTDKIEAKIQDDIDQVISLICRVIGFDVEV